jgi:hypothetical protein
MKLRAISTVTVLAAGLAMGPAPAPAQTNGGPPRPPSSRVLSLTQKCESGKQSACNELVKVAAADKDTSERRAALSLLPLRVVSANRQALGKIAADQTDPVHGMAALKLNEVLLKAASDGDAGTVRSLLDLGADPNASSGDAGILRVTALMFAARNGRRDVVELLLEKGANVNAVAIGRDYVVMPNGATAVPGWTTTAAEIAARVPGSTIKHPAPETALSLARAKGHDDIAELLVKAGAKDGSAGPERKPETAAKPAPAAPQSAADPLPFVAMPPDISCTLEDLMYGGSSASSGWNLLSVGGITCKLGTGKEREIALAAPAVKAGILTTRNFGEFQIQVSGNAPRASIAIALHPPQLAALREFLSR